MKNCAECKGKMEELKGKTQESIEYSYFKCKKCGDEVLSMNQLHNVAKKYRELKRYNAKISKWGQSLGLRIPKELVKKYKFENEKEVTIIPEDSGIKIIPT